MGVHTAINILKNYRNVDVDEHTRNEKIDIHLRLSLLLGRLHVERKRKSVEIFRRLGISLDK